MQPLRYTLATGQEARNFRKALAAKCCRPDKSMLTTKFRLECSDSALKQLDREKLSSLYDILEGTALGSLTYLVFVLQACGFRIFPKFANAKAFADRNAYHDESFNASITQIIGKDWPEFTPSAIVVRLKKEVRARGGKDNRFVEEIIAKEYNNDFKVKGDEQKENIIRSIAKNLAEKFSSWSDLKNRIEDACHAVDEALEAYSKNLPKIASMYAVASGADSSGQESTIVFDDEAVPYACDPEILPYCAVATALSHSEKKNGTEAQTGITTGGKHEGLSWLLGKGLSKLRNASINELQVAFGIPDDKILAIHQLKEAIDAIPLPHQFLDISSNDSYSIFRQNLGGHLDSWIANYVNRLLELDEMLNALPDRLTLPSTLDTKEYDILFKNIATSNEVGVMIDALEAEKQQAKSAIDKLLGRGQHPEKNDISSILNFSEQINDLVSLRDQISNEIENRKKDASKEEKARLDAISSSFEQWSILKKFPKLNVLTGGVPDIRREIENDAIDFQNVRDAYEAHVARIREWLDNIPSLITVQMEREAKKLERYRTCTLQPLEQAVRFLLHKIGHTARMHPGPVCDMVRNWFLKEEIFAEKKQGKHTYLNSFFINRKWPLYTSPFSSRRNFACPIKPIGSVAEAEKLWSDIQNYVENIVQDATLNSTDFEALQAMVRTVTSLELTRIEDDVPADIAEIKLPERFMDTLPNRYFSELKVGTVSANTFRRAFNAYTSVLSGLNIRLRRQEFYLRTKFTWVDNTELLYVPKNAFWAVPERYRAVPEWKAFLDSEQAVWAGSRLDVKATFEAIKKIIGNPDSDRLKDFLVQMPHDWFYELPVEKTDQDKQKISVLSVKKKDCKPKSAYASQLARLVGPSSMKSRLDARLLAKHGEDIGDMTILCDFKVHQSYSDKGLFFEYEDPAVSLAVPVSEKQEAVSDEKPLFTRIVAIDQGEVGLAFAVFNLSDFGKEDAMPISSGTVRINSIRRLIKAGKQFRKGGQLVQKFNQRFDSTMFNMRKNVVGDVCSVIEGLMKKFHAFPILENEVKNLESGSKQLTLVYKAVNSRFLESDSDMPNRERAAWWYGAKYWLLPGFKFRKQDGTQIDLLLSPGRSVQAASTSRICSVCRRNVFDFIKNLEGKKKVTVKEGGIVAIPGCSPLKLYTEIHDSALKAQYVRQNLFAPMLEPISPGEIDVNELKALIRKNMRRRHASRQSKDTTQSVYYCVFADCPSHDDEWQQHPSKYRGLKMLKERHADVNAAINIGRRFLNSDRIEKS